MSVGKKPNRAEAGGFSEVVVSPEGREADIAIVEVADAYYTGERQDTRDVIAMAIKESFQGRLEKLADGYVPRLVATWGDLQRRLDELNCSLATRAVPAARRSRVSEWSLRRKAEQAGQGKVELRAVRPPESPGSSR